MSTLTPDAGPFSSRKNPPTRRLAGIVLCGGFFVFCSRSEYNNSLLSQEL